MVGHLKEKYLNKENPAETNLRASNNIIGSAVCRVWGMWKWALELEKKCSFTVHMHYLHWAIALKV